VTIDSRHRSVELVVLLLDDKPEVTGAMVPSWKHVYFDQPYNRENLARKRITSWKHWREVILPFLNRE
jgi:5'-nucleotidase